MGEDHLLLRLLYGKYPTKIDVEETCQRRLAINPNDGERFAQLEFAGSRHYPPNFPSDVRLCSFARARAESERRASGEVQARVPRECRMPM